MTGQVSLCEGSAPVRPASPAFLELLKKGGGGKGPLGVTCKLWATLHRSRLAAISAPLYARAPRAHFSVSLSGKQSSLQVLGGQAGPATGEMQLGGALRCHCSVPHLQDHGI